jgi:hypothetical protein
MPAMPLEGATAASARLRDAGLAALRLGDLDRAKTFLERLEIDAGEPADFFRLARAIHEVAR